MAERISSVHSECLGESEEIWGLLISCLTSWSSKYHSLCRVGSSGGEWEIMSNPLFLPDIRAWEGCGVGECFSGSLPAWEPVPLLRPLILPDRKLRPIFITAFEMPGNKPARPGSLVWGGVRALHGPCATENLSLRMLRSNIELRVR